MGFEFFMRFFLLCSLISFFSCGRGERDSKPVSSGESGTVASVTGTEEDKTSQDKTVLFTQAGESPSEGSETKVDGDTNLKPVPIPKTEPEPKRSDNVSGMDGKEKESFLEFKNWKIKREQIVGAGLLEEGNSPAFSYYLLTWLNMIDSYISEVRKKGKVHPFYELFIPLLCPDQSKCLDGLDLKQINKSMILPLLDLASNHPLMYPFGTSAVILLQGILSTQFSLALRAFILEDNTDEKITKIVESYMNEVKESSEKIKEKGAKIIINFPLMPVNFGNDFAPFLYLGELIKEYEMELYVVGGCNVYCANYLLPAAKTVYIEPSYGYITTRGSFEGLEHYGSSTKATWLAGEKIELLKRVSSEEQSEEVLRGLNEYTKPLTHLAVYEKEYFEKVMPNLSPQRSFSYRDFLYASSLLVKDMVYEVYNTLSSTVPRFYLSVLEAEKPHWIAPSVGLLRELGLDVRGENNIERVFNMSEENKEKLLYLDDKSVKKCSLFGTDPTSYTSEMLDQCLAL